MEYFIGFLTIGLVGLLAAMSPGPDFILVTKNSLLHSRKAGIYTGVGIGAGILVHVLYSVIGIGLVISQSILLFSIMKYIGAAYLCYLGVRLLRTKPKETTPVEMQIESGDMRQVSAMTAFREGFINSAINPKTTLFFLSVFTQFVGPHTSSFIQALYGIEIAFIVTIWFTFLAFTVTVDVVKQNFDKIQMRASRVMGGLLVLLGVKVALATNR